MRYDGTPRNENRDIRVTPKWKLTRRGRFAVTTTQAFKPTRRSSTYRAVQAELPTQETIRARAYTRGW